MIVLLDTHVLLWALAEPERIPVRTRELLESAETTVLFSAASIWELSIKLQLRKVHLPVTPEEAAAAAIRTGFRELPVTAAHAAGVHRLPLHHRDPFDRLLVAQAIHEPAHLVTVDRELVPYTELVMLAQ